MVIPSLPTSEAVFLAAGVLGATIMPHVIYLHSSLTQHLHGGRAKRYSATKWDVAIAMTIAGFVNLAMMATAAAAFHFNGHTGIADLDRGLSDAGAVTEPCGCDHIWLKHGGGRSLLYGGRNTGRAGGHAGVRPLPYTAVGTSHRHNVALICGDPDGAGPNTHSGHEPVLLSFGIALALVPLLIFTSNKDLMGELVNTTLVKRTGWVIVVVVVALNLWLLIGTALGL